MFLNHFMTKTVWWNHSDGQKQKTSPWITKSLKNACKKKDTLSRKWQCFELYHTHTHTHTCRTHTHIRTHMQNTHTDTHTDTHIQIQNIRTYRYRTYTHTYTHTHTHTQMTFIQIHSYRTCSISHIVVFPLYSVLVCPQKITFSQAKSLWCYFVTQGWWYAEAPHPIRHTRQLPGAPQLFGGPGPRGGPPKDKKKKKKSTLFPHSIKSIVIYIALVRNFAIQTRTYSLFDCKDALFEKLPFHNQLNLLLSKSNVECF